MLLLHFAIPEPNGWRTEDECKADRSVTGRIKLHYAMNCFGRSIAEMEALVMESGFIEVAVHQLAGTLAIPGDDDIAQQHFLIARRT